MVNEAAKLSTNLFGTVRYLLSGPFFFFFSFVRPSYNAPVHMVQEFLCFACVSLWRQ